MGGNYGHHRNNSVGFGDNMASSTWQMQRQGFDMGGGGVCTAQGAERHAPRRGILSE